VTDLSMTSPSVSKHLRVLNEVGTREVPGGGASPAVPPGTRVPPPLYEWLAKYEQAWE